MAGFEAQRIGPPASCSMTSPHLTELNGSALPLNVKLTTNADSTAPVAALPV